jgi:hypothetical protein
MIEAINNLPFSGLIWGWIILFDLALVLHVACRLYRWFSFTPVKVKNSDGQDKRKGTGSSEQIPPVSSLNNAPTAQAIWQEINLSQFQHMLTALQSALKQSGYQLTFHGQGVQMHPHREEQVADNLMRARELFWAPNQTPDDIENLIASTRKSGYGKKMLREMLASCARRHWHLTPVRSDRELKSYPLRQVEVRVRGGVLMPVADLLPCLEAMAGHVGDRPAFSEGEEKDVYRRGTFRAGDSDAADVEYEVRLRNSDEPPGFFPEAAGTKCPPCVEQEKESLRTTFRTQITVFVQGTFAPETGTGARTAFYLDAVRQIRNGEKQGADYDDDSGYAFFVNYTDNALVPRDANGNAKEI